MNTLRSRWRSSCAATCLTLVLAVPANATVVTLNGTVPGSGTPFAFGQDGSSNYFAIGGIYGINGDFEADVASDNGLLTHVTNWPATFITTPKASSWASGSCSVTTSSGACISAGVYNHATVQNPTFNTATLYCNWGSTASPSSGNSVSLLPGQTYTCGPSSAGCPNSSTALNCIGTAALNAYEETN